MEKQIPKLVDVSQLYSCSTVTILMMMLLLLTPTVIAWTGEIRGRVVCDVCGDSSIGPEDHVLQGAEVAVLCITKSGEVVNYQAFTDTKGVYNVAETMPESERWDACLVRPIGSFHERCNQEGNGSSGVKFTYKRPSGCQNGKEAENECPMIQVDMVAHWIPDNMVPLCGICCH